MINQLNIRFHNKMWENDKNYWYKPPRFIVYYPVNNWLYVSLDECEDKFS